METTKGKCRICGVETNMTTEMDDNTFVFECDDCWNGIKKLNTSVKHLRELSNELNELDKLFDIEINQKLERLIKEFGYEFVKEHFRAYEYTGNMELMDDYVYWFYRDNDGDECHGYFPYELLDDSEFEKFIVEEKEKQLKEKQNKIEIDLGSGI